MRVALVLALAAVALRKPDATVGDAVDSADVDAVRTDHFHVPGDLVRGHLVSPCAFTDCAGALGANLGECLVWHRWGIVRLRLDRLEAIGRRRACRGHAGALATSGSVAWGMPRWGLRPTSREAARP